MLCCWRLLTVGTTTTLYYNYTVASAYFLLLKRPLQKARHHAATQEAIQSQQVKLLMSQCFVGGVHYDIGMKDIRDAFQPFGVIKTVDLNVDPLTGRHKGYAYVEYDLPESAQDRMSIDLVFQNFGYFFPLTFLTTLS